MRSGGLGCKTWSPSVHLVRDSENRSTSIQCTTLVSYMRVSDRSLRDIALDKQMLFKERITKIGIMISGSCLYCRARGVTVAFLVCDIRNDSYERIVFKKRITKIGE